MFGPKVSDLIAPDLAKE
jgi:hypothetical protein